VITVGSEVAAYALADVVDGNGHVEQVSVHPEHSGSGHGRRLVERFAQWSGVPHSPHTRRPRDP
jgi:ribosomal protein S18 acetylase RimI-like enzyme